MEGAPSGAAPRLDGMVGHRPDGSRRTPEPAGGAGPHHLEPEGPADEGRLPGERLVGEDQRVGPVAGLAEQRHPDLEGCVRRQSGGGVGHARFEPCPARCRRHRSRGRGRAAPAARRWRCVPGRSRRLPVRKGDDRRSSDRPGVAGSVRLPDGGGRARLAGARRTPVPVGHRLVDHSDQRADAGQAPPGRGDQELAARPARHPTRPCGCSTSPRRTVAPGCARSPPGHRTGDRHGARDGGSRTSPRRWRPTPRRRPAGRWPDRPGRTVRPSRRPARHGGTPGSGAATTARGPAIGRRGPCACRSTSDRSSSRSAGDSSLIQASSGAWRPSTARPLEGVRPGVSDRPGGDDLAEQDVDHGTAGQRDRERPLAEPVGGAVDGARQGPVQPVLGHHQLAAVARRTTRRRVPIRSGPAGRRPVPRTTARTRTSGHPEPLEQRGTGQGPPQRVPRLIAARPGPGPLRPPVGTGTVPLELAPPVGPPCSLPPRGIRHSHAHSVDGGCHTTRSRPAPPIASR